MQFTPVVYLGQSKEQTLASALAGRHVNLRQVYVVGVENGDMLSMALSESGFEIDELDAEVSLRFHYSEFIGEEGLTPLSELLARARQRAHDLQRMRSC